MVVASSSSSEDCLLRRSCHPKRLQKALKRYLKTKKEPKSIEKGGKTHENGLGIGPKDHRSPCKPYGHPLKSDRSRSASRFWIFAKASHNSSK